MKIGVDIVAQRAYSSAPHRKVTGRFLVPIVCACLLSTGLPVLGQDGAPPSPLEPKGTADQKALTPASDPSGLWAPSLDEPATAQSFRLPLRDRLHVDVALAGGDPRVPSLGEYAGTTGIWQPLDSVSLKAGFGMGQQGTAPMSALGCLAGQANYLDCIALRAASAASETAIETYSVGASWQPHERFPLSVDYVNQNQQTAFSDPFAPARLSSASANIARTQALDLSLSCDIDAGNLGDLELGLQLSRVVQGDELLQPARDVGQPDPYHQAVLGLGWQRGDFRGDFTSRHMDWLGEQGQTPEAWTTFDISFAWRTPWNASLSVGARNLLNSPAPNAATSLSDVQVDEFLGRVPYVRYKQDL